MSRCFPFPPPGYEKKASADDENLLKKEKQKEKKHKKEKSREKREGKEKDNDRSEEKHKEKKERKDKHKEKKDKHKDKERESVLIKKDAARLPEHGSVKQVGPSPVQNCEPSNSAFLLELSKRIGNNADRATEKPLLVQKFTLAGKRNAELPGKDKGGHDRKANGQHNELGGANGFIQKFDGIHRESIGVGGLVENSVEKRTEHGGDDKEKNGEIRLGKLNGRDREKKSEGEGGLVGKSVVEKRKEQEEDNKQKNGESRGGEHKEGDREKKSKSKDKKKEKEKEKEKEKGEKKKQNETKKEQLKQRENSKSGAESDYVKTALDHLKERSGSEGNIGKRKEFGTNGYLHDDSRSNKLPKLISSTRQLVENGRKPESCKTAIRVVADVDGNKVPSPLSVAGKGKITNPCARPVPSTLQIVENGRRSEPCKPAIHFVAEVGEGNKRISISSSVAENEKISGTYPRPVSSTHQLVENERRPEPCKPAIHFIASAVAENEKISEPFPRPVSSTLQLVKNGKRPEPCKPAIHFVAEVGKGNKGVSTSSAVAENEKILEPFPRPGVVISASQNDENGRKIEPCKTSIPGIPVGKGDSRVLSSLSVAANRRKNDLAPYSQPDLANGRKIEQAITADQLTSGKHVVVINHKANDNEFRVNGKEMAQQSHSLKRPSSSSKQVKEKPPHPDCKYLSRILSVPEVEWDRFDDQEWLFGSRSDLQQAKRSKVDSSPVEGTTKQVWAEALRLESADVIALPYVVPF